MTVKKLFKIIVISFIATIIRSMLQTIIPSAKQLVLQPSIFSKNGTLPIVFMVYGTVAYTAITIIFLLIHKGIGGNKISKGLKTGVIYAFVWTAYLFEPLPHVSNIDLISYPIADSSVLLILGLMSGIFLSANSPNKKHKLTIKSILSISIIAFVFSIGRIIQYKIFHIYSLFEQYQVKTLIWVICTGIILGSMFEYLNSAIDVKNDLKKALIFGGIVFGVNLFFFNFFMPLVLDVNIFDLIIRTFIDICSVIVRCLIINIMISKELMKG